MTTEFVSTNKTLQFTEELLPYNCEFETLALISTKYIINGVSIKSKQPLKFKLIFYGNNKFNDPDSNTQKCIGSVDLDLTSEPSFRINNEGQYTLNIEDLEIYYADFTNLKKLYIGLMNLSSTTKFSGTNGEVQLIIKASTRL